MASILGSPASSSQFPTCNLSTVWGALHSVITLCPLMTQTGHTPVSSANERLQNHSDARDRPQPIGYPAIWPWQVGANATGTIETPHAEDPNRFHYHHRRGCTGCHRDHWLCCSAGSVGRAKAHGAPSDPAAGKGPCPTGDFGNDAVGLV